MDKEEFHAVLKLVSGEEIFAKVCPCEEEDKTLLILESPVIFEMITIRQAGVQALKIHPWLKMSDDPVLDMNMQNVMTMTEVNDKQMIKFYTRYLNEDDIDIEFDGKVSLNNKMGFLTTVDDARLKLEEIFKNNIDKPNNP